MKYKRWFLMGIGLWIAASVTGSAYAEAKPGLQLTDREIDYTYAPIYQMSLSVPSGAQQTFSPCIPKECIRDTNWTGQLDELEKKSLQKQGGYESIAKVTPQESVGLKIEIDQPGVYEVSWYMRGHHYEILRGEDPAESVGAVTFPTDELHYSVNKIE